ncbi:hypothetical protein NEOLEDRAFT_1148935 [Neolentinus lepideus HHB14362 ss-1]|uniref:Fe2OG dioxygenase domain-containing protein n=1 Tax=Neolentinus lepideus HHB14362 ss-1 TaxID=1314782 RepID=A0A165RPD6_9AGAM|nr:hypothetical protein NEOLEDRAFT_1148935 [Neolentinus lepideus HHB14362 ss-1]
MGEGDTNIVLDILPCDLANVAFDRLKKEVKWSTMHHRGGEVPRLVAVEGTIDEDGSFPIYRHPADESPRLHSFSPTVSLIKDHVEKVLDHPVNHVLIQLYRSGADYISEHSDKTIDVVKGSKIVNVSLGAQRIMVLQTKKDASLSFDGPSNVPTRRVTQRIPLPHNSMFNMGLDTNRKWMHGIRPDKRPESVKTDSEKFANGERISLTFRNIGTFLTANESYIYGQGAKGKTKHDRRPVVNGPEEAAKLIQAFGTENHDSTFEWGALYGQGFDVLHFTTQKEAH